VHSDDVALKFGHGVEKRWQVASIAGRHIRGNVGLDCAMDR